MRLSWYSHSFTFPGLQEPEWSAQVERWSQLDAASFGVTEVFWHNREHLQSRPEWMLLCSPGASNRTDHQFAQAPVPSPAKFVHTLPNIRSAALLQVMKWSGQVLCLQKDPSTILNGLREALQLAEDGSLPIWVVSINQTGSDMTAYIFVLDREGPLKISKSPSQAMENAASHDKQWLSWLNTKEDRPAFKGSDLWIE